MSTHPSSSVCLGYAPRKQLRSGNFSIMIIPMSIREFPKLIEKSKTMERLKNGGSKVMKTHEDPKRDFNRRNPIVDPKTNIGTSINSSKGKAAQLPRAL
ncbi:hypothetical protein CR513_12774, partial [Mucuna pruriens]